MNKKKNIVVFTGAGVSADSGIATFRDADGLWANYRIEEVCTPEALRNNNTYTDIATDGTLAGPNVAAMKEMASAVSLDVIASGGVGNTEQQIILRTFPYQPLNDNLRV